ncbi:MAG: hypothetical protein NWE78_00090 [Candidatus Bathyarchaeota archaeon]|nr:hypothetical protein [Candidatus Bathyarchaeota archaeon]
MSGKKASLRVLDQIPQTFKVDDLNWDSAKLACKIGTRLMTREEKMREASKPLYLKRYE